MIRNTILFARKQIIRNFQFVNINKFTFARKKDTKVNNSAIFEAINKRNDTILNTGQEKKPEVVKSDGKITEKLLCDIIGCKYYPKNEEINIDDSTIVTVYDESDKLQGQKSMKELKEYVNSVNKDIVLRNDKSTPPIVKVMRYRVELVKRLMKKLGKKVDKTNEKQNTFKFIQLNIGISEGDFAIKKERCREILNETAYLKLVVPCNLDNNEDVLKATSMLKNIIDHLSEVGKVKVIPTKKRGNKINKVEDPTMSSSGSEFNKADQEIEKAMKEGDLYKIESERDLQNINCMYAEIESLMIDSSGVDYEKMLEDINIEGLVKGISVTTPDAMTADPSAPLIDSYTTDILNSKKETETKIEQQIFNLEKQSVLLNDKRKRLEIDFKIYELKQEMESKSVLIKSRALKKHMRELCKISYNLSQNAKTK
jgi:translation initiation factor IF-3